MSTTEQQFEELYQRALLAAGGPQARDFESALNLFLEWARAMRLRHYEKTHPQGLASGLFKPRLEIEKGPKYVRVIASDSTGPSRSAWAFINRTNGDILKPAGMEDTSQACSRKHL